MIAVYATEQNNKAMLNWLFHMEQSAGFAEADFLEVWVSTLCPFSYFTQLPDVSLFSYLPFGKKQSFCYMTSGSHVVH